MNFFNPWALRDTLGEFPNRFFLTKFTLGPAKTYILRGTPRTRAIKTRAVTDNWTIKKGPRKGNGGSVRGSEGPVTGTGPLLIARNPF